MIFLFTWNNSDYLNSYLKKWKSQFVAKYWDYDLTTLNDIENVESSTISDLFLSTSFLSESKLIIIPDFDKIEKNETKKQFFIDILEKIPSQNNIIFLAENIPERSRLYKAIAKYWTVKKFDLKDESSIKEYLMQKYSWKIDSWAINQIISYKNNNLQKIILELEKLFITKEFVTEKDIVENIVPEFEKSIFNFIDKLLKKDKKWALEDFKIILNNIDIYWFYNMVLWNLRNYVYISYLKNIWVSSKNISDELSLWNRSFLVNKQINYNFTELFSLYEKFIDFDKNMKSWKQLVNTEENLVYELEKIIVMI